LTAARRQPVDVRSIGSSNLTAIDGLAQQAPNTEPRTGVWLTFMPSRSAQAGLGFARCCVANEHRQTMKVSQR
jgi:hypothetical protein